MWLFSQPSMFTEKATCPPQLWIGFCPVSLLVCLSTFSTRYCNVTISFHSGRVSLPFSFFKFDLANLGPLCFRIHFRTSWSVSTYKKTIARSLIVITQTLKIHLERNDIFRVLGASIHERGMSLCKSLQGFQNLPQ